MTSLLLALDDTATNTATSAAAAGVVGVMILLYVVFIVAIIAFMVWIYWRIAAKMGFNPALSLLMLVPIANLVIIIMVAFGRWPIEEERDALRAKLGGAPGVMPGGTAPGTSLTT